jgi:bifunctional N-acetylglucosamine-1-phosphate-uridyltransferase/glucosamine-1-phosphate-acetyltransferase GlmU-like protein
MLTVTIMAAGEGKRMNSNIPKVLHNFNGIPMLIRIILESSKLNPNRIIIITGKYDILIKDTLKNYFENNNINLFDRLTFINQTVPCGTADAIKYTLESYSDDEEVLILNGDMPLISSNLLEKFISERSPRLLLAQLENPYGYGRILYDNDNKFIGIKEEKDCNEDERLIDITNVGIYYFNSMLLKKYIPMIDCNNVQKEYYLTDIVKVIREHSNISIETYIIEESMKYQIHGVNTKKELEDLEERYKF